MLEMTMKDWMGQGYRLVAEGAVAVRIMGKRPTRIVDDLSPQGEYGWQVGSRWLDESSTLPDPVFGRLKPCPNLPVEHYRKQGLEVMPRWPVESDALNALDYAAWLWALQLTEVGGVTKEHVELLVEIWRKETEVGVVSHPTTEPIIALGRPALPHLRELAKRHSAMYRLIQEIEDR